MILKCVSAAYILISFVKALCTNTFFFYNSSSKICKRYSVDSSQLAINRTDVNEIESGAEEEGIKDELLKSQVYDKYLNRDKHLNPKCEK